jgi:hypothetical protein
VLQIKVRRSDNNSDSIWIGVVTIKIEDRSNSDPNLNFGSELTTKRKIEEEINYLIINEIGPETSQGSFVRIRRQDWILIPSVINILKNHTRF